METFGIIGMTFGIMGFTFGVIAMNSGNAALAKVKALREELSGLGVMPPQDDASA